MIWCANNWVPIKRVIRHRVNKDIYRVRTRNSIIDVTEDHSLIGTEFQQITPRDCVVNQTKVL